MGAPLAAPGGQKQQTESLQNIADFYFNVGNHVHVHLAIADVAVHVIAVAHVIFRVVGIDEGRSDSPLRNRWTTRSFACPTRMRILTYLDLANRKGPIDIESHVPDSALRHLEADCKPEESRSDSAQPTNESASEAMRHLVGMQLACESHTCKGQQAQETLESRTNFQHTFSYARHANAKRTCR